jgi:hypothetical protein
MSGRVELYLSITFTFTGVHVTQSKKIILTVPISLGQQLFLHGKSYFWTKFFSQPPETQKTAN